MGHLEGNFTPVLYMGRKVPKGYTRLRPPFRFADPPALHAEVSVHVNTTGTSFVSNYCTRAKRENGMQSEATLSFSVQPCNSQSDHE